MTDGKFLNETHQFSSKFVIHVLLLVLGPALLPSPHHPEGSLHHRQPPEHLLSSSTQCGRDGGLLQRSVPAARPALPGSAHAT